MSGYLDRNTLEQIVGRETLAIAAPDGSSGIDEAKIASAIADVNARIEAKLRTSYTLPLALVPSFLSRAAARLVHAELVDETSSSELILERARAAWRVVTQASQGTLQLVPGERRTGAKVVALDLKRRVRTTY